MWQTRNDRIEIRSISGKTWKYPLEKTQFSIGGEWGENGCVLELINLFYFQGEEPHEIGTPPEKRGPLFAFKRSISAVEIHEKGLVDSLQAADAKFASDEIPFPAGISFGSCHLAVSEMTYSMTRASDLEFRCRVQGTLRRIHEDPRGMDGATFEIAIQAAFEGVWLESGDPEDKEKIDNFYEALFGMMNFTKVYDMFDDAIVLRAGPEN